MKEKSSNYFFLLDSDKIKYIIYKASSSQFRMSFFLHSFLFHKGFYEAEEFSPLKLDLMQLGLIFLYAQKDIYQEDQ